MSVCRHGIVHKLNRCEYCNNFPPEFELNPTMCILCLNDVYIVFLSPDETLEQGQNALRAIAQSILH